MARPRSQSSWMRCLDLSYYVRRPRRLALLCLFFVGTTFLIWDRQTLIREQDALNRKDEEIARLTQERDELKLFLADKGEELPLEFDNQESQGSARSMEDGQKREKDFESRKESHRHAPLLRDHVTLDGSKDAPADPDPDVRDKRDKVREAMIHAWSSYENYAWGYDELKPTSQRGDNAFGGLGATIVDSLDTLYIMGLHDQFKKAKEWVSTNLDFNRHYSASVFETTIRVLGGLLSSYDLSGDPIFLVRARELADRLLPAWETTTGIPLNIIELASGTASNPHWTSGSSVLADLGTEQLEFIALSQRTGVSKYREKVEKTIKKLKEDFPADGLLPIYINPHTGKPTTLKITFGAMGDSFYEYLLKTWIQGNKTHVVQHYRDMWEQSMEGLISLVRKSTPSSYVYLVERSGDSIIEKMDELACFVPGMLVLGMEGASPEKAAQYLDIAEGLAWTCYNFYRSTRTKLAGENYHFRDGMDMSVGTPYNILRPETVESLFYLWRKTGENKYREWGWDIFQAFEAQSRVSTGYVGLSDVNSGIKDDTMQSFFLAETLKYLYLLFSPSSIIPLDEWVFNTEAHPMRIVSRLEETGDNESQDKREQNHREEWAGRKERTDGRGNLQKRMLRKGGKGLKLGSFEYI